MADYNKHFRITVDLSAFFYDHRRVARIFVKSHIKSIADLQTRISEIFEINEFYLTTGGHFLPASEDVRILNNNESVCVIPNKSHGIATSSILKVTSLAQERKRKKQKKLLEVIPEDSEEKSMLKKKKRKKRHVEVTSSSSSSLEDEVPHKKKKTEINESATSSKKKNKRKRKNVDPKYSDNICENETEQTKKLDQSIVEREICNIESSQKIIDIKKKLKQKTDEYINKHSKETMDASSNIKNVLPKLQSHIKNCNDFGRSTLPDTIRLSRHVDTPIKTFSQYAPPPRITDKYLAKNKVNIVQIDIIKKLSENLIRRANLSQSSVSGDNAAVASNENVEKSSFPQNLDESYSQKNYVKDVINSFEKNISPELNKHIGEKEIHEMDENVLDIKESEASNYTKAFLDQTDATTSNNLEYKTDIPVNIGSVPNTTLNSLEHFKSPSTLGSLNTVDTPTAKPLNEEVESTNVSMNISSTTHDSSYLSGNCKDSPLNSTNTSLTVSNSSGRLRNTTSNKRFMGVGTLLEHLRESDSVISHESDTPSQYVTKRKRIRKHKRKNKKSDEGPKPALVEVQTSVVKPMKVKACPSIHIKFEDNEMETMEGKSIKVSDMSNDTIVENGTLNNVEVSSHVDRPQFDQKENKSLMGETMVLSDENDDPIMENKSIFGEESISRAPLMTDKLEPKLGDIIAFKVLKMTDDYTPQVSNYIVGKLEIYLLENRTAWFKILRGEGELLPPSGKLSLKEDTNLESSQYRKFLWTELISPKLLYP